jgi:hypothetical protein
VQREARDLAVRPERSDLQEKRVNSDLQGSQDTPGDPV